ncbi:hypothetical protein B0H13DRAFT_1850394 [Mycena leptocephala]|nr:hypothetical protein B0H13DRAFT_1850394 [Mycena leptocephala]
MASAILNETVSPDFLLRAWDQKRRRELIEHQKIAVEVKQHAESQRQAKDAARKAELANLIPLLDVAEIQATRRGTHFSEQHREGDIKMRNYSQGAKSFEIHQAHFSEQHREGDMKMRNYSQGAKSFEIHQADLDGMYILARPERWNGIAPCRNAGFSLLRNTPDDHFVGSGRMLGLPAFVGQRPDDDARKIERNLRAAAREDRKTSKQAGDKTLVLHANLTGHDMPNKVQEVMLESIGAIRDAFKGKVIRRTVNCKDYEGSRIIRLKAYGEHMLLLDLYDSEIRNLDIIANELAQESEVKSLQLFGGVTQSTTSPALGHCW